MECVFSFKYGSDIEMVSNVSEFHKKKKKKKKERMVASQWLV
jgi:hypothetical protein